MLTDVLERELQWDQFADFGDCPHCGPRRLKFRNTTDDLIALNVGDFNYRMFLRVYDL
ncbi:hypothetical protein D3C86_2098580 [compost metagenome]